MNNLKLTTKQQVVAHLDSLDQTTVSKIVGLLGVITHTERLGASKDQIEREINRKIEAKATSETWLVKTFLNSQAKREIIINELVNRWQYRTDKD